MRWVEVFEGLYGRAPVGCGEAALVAAEARLGVELPAELRGFLSAVGREAVVMEVHDRFLAPDALAVADGRVVFCEENQGVCMWGCAVSWTRILTTSVSYAPRPGVMAASKPWWRSQTA